MSKQAFDVTIIGAGFAGSILAWILSRSGMKVALVDAAVHPRFAIGESSTPIADMILRRLSTTYEIPELAALAYWGEWQQQFPMLACGRKRGFSYFQHDPNRAFSERRLGDHSLLIAASPTDALSDTHWYRPDVDHFFFRHAVEAGASDYSEHRVVTIHRPSSSPSNFEIDCIRQDGTARLRSHWLIDASGASSVAARLLDAHDRSETLTTSTSSTYAHYENVGSWSEHLRKEGHDLSHDPFDSDDAAQHHLLQQGWVWMLRFNNGITSVGQTTPMASQPGSLRFSAYPSLNVIMRDARPVAPSSGPVQTDRLQRLYPPVLDERLLLLPTSALTLDPLHSTGIAHALAGVDRMAAILLMESHVEKREAIERYADVFEEETRYLDALVSAAYSTMSDFQRFTAACSLFIAGAIQCEERYQSGDSPTHLWGADDQDFVRFAFEACSLLRRGDEDFEEEIRAWLRPWNQAGFMDPHCHNRYAYTATKQ